MRERFRRMPAEPVDEMLQASPPPDHAAIGELRARYGIEQLMPLRHRQRMGVPERVRAMTSRWISLVPSKIV